ncbi:MAG: AAA family ATPase [archaeon]
MANVFSVKSDNHIFKDERFLYPDFVPEKLPFRDKEIGELVFCLKPASQGKKPSNAFVFGKPGTGKTVTLKFVLNELEEYSDRAKCIYLNCFELGTRHAILARLTNILGYPVPERGMSGSEIYERFVATLRSKKIIPIVVFDEAEQLLKDEEAMKLLYDFSRLGEQQKLFMGMVFISNDNFFLARLDERVRSSLQASSVGFEPYIPSELKEILKERAEYAFVPNSLDSEVIPLCAAHAAKVGGDARIAVDVLLKAARLAEKDNAKQVLVKHVRAAFMQEKPVKFEITDTLSEQEKLVLDFLGEKEFESGQIYAGLAKRFAERTLREAIASLEKKKLVVATKLEKDRGFSRMIKRAKK